MSAQQRSWLNCRQDSTWQDLQQQQQRRRPRRLQLLQTQMQHACLSWR
jgi:hypothetical protein